MATRMGVMLALLARHWALGAPSSGARRLSETAACTDTTAINLACPTPSFGTVVPSNCDGVACAGLFTVWWELCRHDAAVVGADAANHGAFGAFYAQCQETIGLSPAPAVTAVEITAPADACYAPAFGVFTRQDGVMENGRPVFGHLVGSRTYFVYSAEDAGGQGPTWYLDNDQDAGNAMFAFIHSASMTPPSGSWSIWCGGGRGYEDFVLSVSSAGAGGASAGTPPVPPAPPPRPPAAPPPPSPAPPPTAGGSGKDLQIVGPADACYAPAFGVFTRQDGVMENGRPVFGHLVGSRTYFVYSAEDAGGQGPTWYLDNDQDAGNAMFAFIHSASMTPPSGSWSIWCGGGRGYEDFVLSVSSAGPQSGH